jgi:hypothetical protein
MSRHERRVKPPERPLEVEVSWIVEDTPERYAAWSRLWRFILDRVNSGEHIEQAPNRGERDHENDTI